MASGNPMVDKGIPTKPNAQIAELGSPVEFAEFIGVWCTESFL
jgi:hypothetical protein